MEKRHPHLIPTHFPDAADTARVHEAAAAIGKSTSAFMRDAALAAAERVLQSETCGCCRGTGRTAKRARVRSRNGVKRRAPDRVAA